jgi:two-component sensor histidine kinase
VDQSLEMSGVRKIGVMIAGDPLRFSLEHRIFNSTTIVITSFAIFGSIANHFLGLHPMTVWLGVVGFFVAASFYYYSRAKGVFGIGITLSFVATSILILGTIHFFNGGLDGNVIYLLIMLLNIFLLVVPQGYQATIYVIYYLSFITLLLLEYNFPEWVVPYKSTEERFMDHGVTMFYCLLYTAVVITLFRKNYNQEREKVRQQYIQVKELNSQIDQQLSELEQQKKDLAVAVEIANDKNEKNKILLRELNHRVKNNLQVVSSLLNLQSQSVADEKARAAIIESKNRLLSMVLIHQRLYHNENATQILMPDYLRDLAENIEFTYSSNSQDDLITYAIDPIFLSVEHAIPLGLICNEIITNFFKHVAPKPSTSLCIQFASTDSGFVLCVRDNGQGFDVNNVDGSFGIKLIHSLIKQLGGTSTLTFTPGTSWEIKFGAQAVASKSSPKHSQ